MHLIVPEGRRSSCIVETEVQMRELRDSEIKKYLNQDPKFRTHAIGFDPLNYYSSTFVNSIEGSVHNLTSGMPLETIVKMLNDVGFKM